ncbi:MAG: DNA repair protein RecO [Oscillospiraceae bacterium]|jgi:DNA repair protein RecO (recombination protein O)|nr:DNA repair protein RecO [Oscillospiraceae bacterium]
MHPRETVTVRGIVIGRRDIGEQNRFLDILTDEYGVIEATCYGARKVGGKNSSCGNLFSFCDYSLTKTALRYSVDSAETVYGFFGLAKDFGSYALACYLAELTRGTSAPEQPHLGFTRFFAATLYQIEKGSISRNEIKALFELKLSHLLGILPEFVFCSSCGESPGVLYLSIAEGEAICDDCGGRGYSLHAESLAVLTALQTGYEPYKLRPSTGALAELAPMAEAHLLYHLGRGFKTLDYYKNL